MSVVNKRSAPATVDSQMSLLEPNETETENATSKSSSGNEEAFHHSHIFLRPDVVPALIEMIKHYKWPIVYFIYNHESGSFNISF